MDALRELDRLVAWGAKRGIITGNYLKSFQDTLVALVANYEAAEAKEIEYEVTLRHISEEVDRIKKVVRKTGLTPKAVAEIEAMDDAFVSRYPFTIASDNDMLLMRSHYRAIELRTDADMGSLRQYALIFQKTQDKEMKGKLDPYLRWYRENAEHLCQYFDMIENGTELNIRKIYQELREHYIKN